MISPQELKKKIFTKSIKGYSCAEVDEYISYIISNFSELSAEYAELQRKYGVAVEKLSSAQNEEKVISATILNAQKMADAIVYDAKKKAENINSAVSESCDRIIDAYRQKVALERDKLLESEKAVAAFKNSLLDCYREHVRLIEQIMPDDDVTPYLSDEELEDKAANIARENLTKLNDGDDISVPVIKNENQNQETDNKNN